MAIGSLGFTYSLHVHSLIAERAKNGNWICVSIASSQLQNRGRMANMAECRPPPDYPSKQQVGKRTFLRSAGTDCGLTSIKTSVLTSTCPQVIINESNSSQLFSEHLSSEVTGSRWHSLQGGVCSSYWNLEGSRVGLGPASTKRDFLGHFLGLRLWCISSKCLLFPLVL